MTSNEFREGDHPRNSDGTGRFTEKAQADPGSDVLDWTHDAGLAAVRAVAAVHARAPWATTGEKRLALEATGGDPAAAAAWLDHQRKKVAAHAKANAGFTGMRQARRDTVEASMTACAHRILQEAPGTATIRLDNDDEGGLRWDLDPLNLDEDTTDELVDYLGQVGWMDLRHPGDLAPLCVGYNPHTKLATGLRTSDGTLQSAELDLAALTADNEGA